MYYTFKQLANMKTIKILKTVSNVFGIVWILSVLALVITMTFHIKMNETERLILLTPFAFAWLVAFVSAYEANEREIKIIRGY